MTEEEEPSRTEGCQQPGSALPAKPLSPKEKEGEQEKRGVSGGWREERLDGGTGGGRQHGRTPTHSLVICATFSMAV